ncbi:MAG TPA: hypothetical protein VK571_09080 [Gemmatimonadaceae bacterium]|nr:hypothetical protein [Gemmatimonadaceae bacterium]
MTDKLMIGDAFERFKAEYEAEGQRYHCAEREYYSTGSIIFNVAATTQAGGAIILAGAFPRYVLHAAPMQTAQLFAYKVGDAMQVANTFTANGTASRVADISDTNVLRAYETNDEDFAVRGIGFSIKSLRIEFTPGGSAYTTIGLPADFSTVITTGSGYLDDPGSHIMPPEIDSPLLLQDQLGRAISKRLRVREVWDNRASDDIALARRMGPAGSESYLKALGAPSTTNSLRLDPGLMWRRPNSKFDTRFNLECSLQEDIWTIVSWPQALVAAGAAFGTLLRVHVDYQVILVGHGFYYPSANA